MNGALWISMAVIVLGAGQANAGVNPHRFAASYARETCRPKIEAKHLKGDALKEAWKACKESPESYN